MAFTVFYTVQINDAATKIFEAAGGKAVLTDHFFDEAGYIEELKTIQPEAILCRTEPITAAMMIFSFLFEVNCGSSITM